MGAFSDYLETKLLDYVLRDQADWAPTSVWVGLCTADPTETAANECAVAPYARQRVVFNAANGCSIAGSTAAVTFPQATGSSWGTIHGYAIFDASSAGSMLFYANLASDVTVNANDTVEFASNAIVITLD
jgi:hypothetical protein